MDTTKSSAPHAHDHDDLDTHYSGLERPHACYEGVVYIGHLVEEDGEEVEVLTPIACRRCSETSR